MSSPRNHDASMIQGQQGSEICYCCQDWNVEGVSKKDIVWVSCSTCHEWWHVICAGLTGYFALVTLVCSRRVLSSAPQEVPGY